MDVFKINDGDDDEYNLKNNSTHEHKLRLTESNWFVRSTLLCRHLAAASLLRSLRIRRRSSSKGLILKV